MAARSRRGACPTGASIENRAQEPHPWDVSIFSRASVPPSRSVFRPGNDRARGAGGAARGRRAVRRVLRRAGWSAGLTPMSWRRVPHNSGHLTLRCQRDQPVRTAVASVVIRPLGRTELLRPAAANLLGDLWTAVRLARGVFASQVKLHLYGKLEPRPGRKMGHLRRSLMNLGKLWRRVLRARDAAARRKTLD